MYRGIYIGGHDIREYGAKLQTDYAISGYDVTNTVNQGFNRSNVLLLPASHLPAAGFLRQGQNGDYGPAGGVCSVADRHL